ncbi:hypothetical protein M569_08669, partial [Genlisea aurea]
MGGEILPDTWFGSIWKSSRKEPGKKFIGILSFEVSKLMSKVVCMWKCLSDEHIIRLREDFANSVGIQRLVSEDIDYLMDLAISEIIDNLISVAKSVSVLGKKCTDPKYHNLGFFQEDGADIDPKFYGWHYKLKQMEKKIKKMEKCVAVTEQLYLELEVLSELEQALRQLKAGSSTVGRVKLLELQQKVDWQRQEVKGLQEISPWSRTYDYIVQIILRCLLTILERVKYIYGVKKIENTGITHGDDSIHGDNTIRALLQMPEENESGGDHLERRTISDLGLGWNKTRLKNRKQPLSRSSSFILSSKPHLMKTRRLTPVGLIGCMTSANESESYPPICGGGSFRLNEERFDEMQLHLCSSSPTKLSSFLLKATPFSGAFLSPAYDPALAADWSSAVARILEWLAPLAHNMVTWQSERNFDRKRMKCGSIVLQVQTLHFADKSETEAAIVELLMGLNYLSRFGGKKTFLESTCSGTYSSSSFI